MNNTVHKVHVYFHYLYISVWLFWNNFSWFSKFNYNNRKYPVLHVPGGKNSYFMVILRDIISKKDMYKTCPFRKKDVLMRRFRLIIEPIFFMFSLPEIHKTNHGESVDYLLYLWHIIGSIRGLIFLFFRGKRADYHNIAYPTLNLKTLIYKAFRGNDLVYISRIGRKSLFWDFYTLYMGCVFEFHEIKEAIHGKR
jgi:hypothetical protein